MRALLGTNLETQKPCLIDLARLIETRLLIQANSGGGKSYLIRKLLEESYGQVQQIVLDIEGEFASLRTKFDYVLAGKGGDVAADPKTAEILARKLLELGASAIIDLYELKQRDRLRYVRLFLDALINAPKDLWHPVLIIIDEAHLFAPEKGNSEAMSAVIDLATRGRKREFCAVLATQRIAKLHKDAAAECLNKLIGGAALDIDMKRASDELGFTSRQEQLMLRQLEPGEFYAFGPALSKTVQKIQVGEIATPHGKAARKQLMRPAAPTAKIKQILAKLTDIPKEAEEELTDRAALKTRVKELERELQARRAPSHELQEASKTISKLQLVINEAARANDKLGNLLKTPLVILSSPSSTPLRRDGDRNTPRANMREVKKLTAEKETGELGLCERKILGFLVSQPGKVFSKIQVGALTGYRHSSGGFKNALCRLASQGIIQRSPNGVTLIAPPHEIEDLADTVPHKLKDWIAKLGACERAIYQKLLDSSSSCFEKEGIAEATGYSASSGGFKNAICRLVTLGLVIRTSEGRLAINPEVTEVA